MSHSQAFESQFKNSDKAHESGHQAAANIAAQAWHPSEAGQAKQIKSEPNGLDFSKAGDIYASKAMISASTGDPKLLGGAHTTTDNAQANTMGGAKPADSGIIKTQPEIAPNIYDFSNKKQGETKPAVGFRPDTSNDVAADGKKQNNDAVAAAKYDKSRENSDVSEPAVPINRPDEKTQPDDKPASSDKPNSSDKPASSSSISDSWHKLQDLWGSEITTLLGYGG